MFSFGQPHMQRDVLSTFLVSGISLFSLGYVVSPAASHTFSSSCLMLALSLATGLLLITGMGRMQRTLAIFGSLEQRLGRVGPATCVEEMAPMLDSSTVAAGWNQLLEKLHRHSWDQGIERRLSQVPTDAAAQRYARALRSLSDGLSISDQHGRLYYANPSWHQLLKNEAVDANLPGELISPMLAACGFTNWEEVFPQLLVGTKPLRFELLRGTIVADGVLQLSRLPLAGRVQENAGYVWTLREITQLCLANQAHEQFLSSASHELRTPLANITAYSESLLEMDNIPAAQQREFFNVIHAEAQRLSRLLNELLDIQQLEAGSMTIQTSPFDVQRMLQEIHEHIAPLIEKKRLKFICRIAPDIKSIQADKEKIISCLVNLLGNAIKYTPEEGEIRLIAEQHEGGVSIAVEDNGIGIAAEEQDKIFDRFYRCHDPRVSEIEGNGLGLAFALEVARLHQGDLKVHSQLNVGSKFTLRLPHSASR